MTRVALWILGLLIAPVWVVVLFLAGAWLGSTIDDLEIGFIFGLMILGPIPLVAALALRRGNLRRHPLRAAFSAGMAAGGYLAMLVIGAALISPFFLFLATPIVWIFVAILFVIPVFVWPLLFRKPAPPEEEQPPEREREVIRFP